MVAVSERSSSTRGNYTDGPCWYVSVRDAGRFALVLGPFATESACREWAYWTESADELGAINGGNSDKHRQVLKAAERDPKSPWYAWGMVKMPNGYRDGVLNVDLPQADRDMHIYPEVTR